MACSFQYKVEATDNRGILRTLDFIVVAQDEREAHDELAAVFDAQEVIESWRIAESLDVIVLPADDAFAKDYAEKGAHSYFESM